MLFGPPLDTEDFPSEVNSSNKLQRIIVLLEDFFDIQVWDYRTYALIWEFIFCFLRFIPFSKKL